VSNGSTPKAKAAGDTGGQNANWEGYLEPKGGGAIGQAVVPRGREALAVLGRLLGILLSAPALLLVIHTSKLVGATIFDRHAVSP